MARFLGLDRLCFVLGAKPVRLASAGGASQDCCMLHTA
jgi:hypothetical protein